MRTWILAAALFSGARAGAEPLAGRSLLTGPDGRLAFFPDERTVELLDGAGAALRTVVLPAPAAAAAFSPDGEVLAVCTHGGGLRLYPAAGGERSVEGSGSCSELAWSADGSALLYVLRAPDGEGERLELKRAGRAGGAPARLRDAARRPPAESGAAPPPPPPAPAAPAADAGRRKAEPEPPAKRPTEGKGPKGP